MSSIKDFFKPVNRGDPVTIDLTASSPAHSIAKPKEDKPPAGRKRSVDTTPVKGHPPQSAEEESASKKPKSSYAQFLKRKTESGPSAPGSKAIPEGAPNCLLGLAFVFTGELSSISREDAQDLVKRYGARVTTAPSGKTDYVVVGENAGDSKLEKVRQLGLKTLDEDQLLDLIRTSKAKDFHPQGSPKKVSPAKKRPSKKDTDEEYEAPAPPKGAPVALHDQLIVDKYAPRSVDELLGNQGIYEKLLEWLRTWPGENKAVLLSGPPGIGKTTMARLAASEAGMSMLELNASDTRSKKALDEHLKDILNQTTIQARSRATRKQVIVMDECDGMSAGDRGGVAELIQLIKKTKSPIICICNDRSNPKVRNLANYCMDLRLRRPEARQVVPRLREIATAEGLTMQPNALEELVSGAHGDLRQVLNVIRDQALVTREMTFDASKAVHGKDVEVGVFDAIGSLLGSGFAHKSMAERLDLFFVDDGLVPLMIHENYAKFKPSSQRPFRGQNANKGFGDYYAQAAECISASDHVSSLIRGANQEWWLSPAYGLLGSVMPAYLVHGPGTSRIDFSTWFGVNSRQQKFLRLSKTLANHSYLKLALNWRQFVPVIPVLADEILEPLVQRGADGIADAIRLIDEYRLTKDDFESLLELSGLQDIWAKQVPTAVKSALTRRYNATGHMLPYSVEAEHQGPARRIAVDLVDGDNEEDDISPEDDATNEAEDELPKPKKTVSKKK